MKQFIVAIAASLTLVFAPGVVVHADPPEVTSVSYEDTRSVQRALSNFGYVIAVDGFYGPQTVRAVKHWQRVNGLLVDGIAGPVTLPTLLGAKRSATQSQTASPPPAPTPQPTDFNCESWRPLFVKHNIPFDKFLPIMQRESRCSNARNYNVSTRDDSFGVLQTNRWGNLDAVWTRNGMSRSEHATPEGGVRAAAMLYRACGSMGPWVKPYTCPLGGLR